MMAANIENQPKTSDDRVSVPAVPSVPPRQAQGTMMVTNTENPPKTSDEKQKQADSARKRETSNRSFTILSVVFALVSFGAGLCPSVKWGLSSHKQLGEILVAIWVVFPPIFFWYDWVWFPDYFTDKDARDIAKHTHDLSRNIWVAYAAILAYLFGIKPFQ
jgi:hypothetical protein